MGENSQVLSFKDVQKSDSGVYQCMSENSEGVLLKEAILKVTGKLLKYLQAVMNIFIKFLMLIDKINTIT